MPLVLKLDEKTKAPIVTEDNKIIYYDDADPDKKDLPLDPVGMYTKIGDLGRQNKIDRDKYREVRDKLAPLKDIEDLVEWKANADKALVTVENFNDKDWMKADKVDKLKADMKESYDTQLKGKDTVLANTLKEHGEVLGGKDRQIRTLMVSNKFAVSPFFTGKKRKTILPPDIGESTFGKHYKVEEIDGKSLLRAYRDNGDPILSKVNPGEPAGFNESMEIIIDEYSNRDSILSAPGSGSGGQGGHGEGETNDDLAALKKQHADALAAHQTQLAISLKGKIFKLEHPDR